LLLQLLLCLRFSSSALACGSVVDRYDDDQMAACCLLPQKEKANANPAKIVVVKKDSCVTSLKCLFLSRVAFGNLKGSHYP